jgi:hypothetical protein
MKIDGCCHCGYVTFEAEADPENDDHLQLCGTAIYATSTGNEPAYKSTRLLSRLNNRSRSGSRCLVLPSVRQGPILRGNNPSAWSGTLRVG